MHLDIFQIFLVFLLTVILKKKIQGLHSPILSFVAASVGK